MVLIFELGSLGSAGKSNKNARKIFSLREIMITIF